MLALDDVRVLDLSSYMAGPYCTWLLADMGAEVIKIESCSRPEPLRIAARGIYPGGDPGERPWNRSGMVNERLRDKYGITLDITKARGRDIFLKLVKISDVVVENFQARVMRNLNIEYRVLAGVNPAIILVSISSQGLTGPESGYRSFGPTLEQMGGLLSITGYPGEPPYLSTLAFPDVLGGMLAAGLVLAALRDSRATGKGMHVDLSQRELTTNVIGEAILDYVMNGRIWQPIGNRHRSIAPHGCYRCKGEDKWITISICSDAQWRQLSSMMGMPELADDPRFIDAVNRHKHQDELDKIISSWTETHGHYHLQTILQQAGIAAGAVLNSQDLYADPHLEYRQFFDSVTHPDAGTHRHPGRPAKLSRTPGYSHKPAPCLAEHNEYVYGKVLGLTQAQIAELEKEGVIGKIPTDEARRFR